MMRSLPFTCVAILAAAFLTGCDSGSSPTAENSPGLTGDAIAHNTADHFTAVESVTFEIESPCNGESITLTGTAESQLTLVDTRENLDAGNSVHAEFQQRTTATGTGSETGATYTINDIYHEPDGEFAGFHARIWCTLLAQASEFTAPSPRLPAPWSRDQLVTVTGPRLYCTHRTILKVTTALPLRGHQRRSETPLQARRTGLDRGDP